MNSHIFMKYRFFEQQRYHIQTLWFKSLHSKYYLQYKKIFFDKTLWKESDVETIVVAYSNDYVFRRVDICRTDNQCLVYSLNVFYKDVDDLKKASALWNVINWSNKPEMHCNDNAFVFNRMLGYNTVFYDIRTKD